MQGVGGYLRRKGDRQAKRKKKAPDRRPKELCKRLKRENSGCPDATILERNGSYGQEGKGKSHD